MDDLFKVRKPQEMLGFDPVRDVGQEVINDMPSQFRNKASLNAFLDALNYPLTLASNVMADILEARHIDKAEGYQLDLIGSNVAQPRQLYGAREYIYFGFRGQPNSAGFGRARLRWESDASSQEDRYLSDEEYRRFLKWKIRFNSSCGTVQDIIDCIKELIDCDRVQVLENHTLAVDIAIDGLMPSGFSDYIINNPDKFIPLCAGTKLRSFKVLSYR